MKHWLNKVWSPSLKNELKKEELYVFSPEQCVSIHHKCSSIKALQTVFIEQVSSTGWWPSCSLFIIVWSRSLKKKSDCLRNWNLILQDTSFNIYYEITVSILVWKANFRMQAGTHSESAQERISFLCDHLSNIWCFPVWRTDKMVISYFVLAHNIVSILFPSFNGIHWNIKAIHNMCVTKKL